MWLIAAFLGIFYLIGIGLLGYGILSAQRTLAAGKWPIAAGKVLSCALTESMDGEGHTTYRVTAEYQYAVGGREYTGERIAYGYGGSGQRDSQLELLNKLEASHEIDVRYDPVAPERCVISFGLHRSIRVLLMFAATWMLLVIGFSLIWWIGMGPDDILLQNLTAR